MKAFQLGIVALLAALTLPAFAQTKPTDMQTFTQQVRADKKLIVATVMKLTDAEAKGFWPVYEAYQKDLDAINKRLASAILAYAEAYKKGNVPNDVARKLTEESFAIEDAELSMKRSYLPKLDKVLPGAKVARYIQLENKVRAGVRFELAAGIPLVE